MNYFRLLGLTLSFILVVGCTDASVASRNLSEAAEQFEIYRRVVFYNGITDNYILSIEGYCSIEDRNTETIDSVYMSVCWRLPDGSGLPFGLYHATLNYWSVCVAGDLLESNLVVHRFPDSFGVIGRD